MGWGLAILGFRLARFGSPSSTPGLITPRLRRSQALIRRTTLRAVTAPITTRRVVRKRLAILPCVVLLREVHRQSAQV